VTARAERLAIGPPDAAKGFRAGTHRTVKPEDTLASIYPRLREFGITRVANVTGLDTLGLPVVMVCRPNTRSVAVSQGKGLTLDAAKASGIMESVELWHAERVSLPLKLATRSELAAKSEVVDLDDLARTGSGRFHDALPILWVEGRDVATGRELWLPLECVQMNTCLPLAYSSGSFLATSNGLASGNIQAEAISHAICEVVERDATTLWHLRGDEGALETMLDLDSVDDDCCCEALALCERAGVSVVAWDVTSDVGIAAFACLITELHAGDRVARTSAMGYGCHPHRGIALLRAITEAAQSRLTFIAGSRDDVFREEYQDNIRVRQSLRRYHEMLAQHATRTFQDAPTYDGSTIHDDVTWELDRLRSVRIDDVVHVDLGDPAIGIPVARIVVPGLEGPDSAPGYSAGRRGRALTESCR
jgi:YcaO-like protein with predicted kinase domain